MTNHWVILGGSRGLGACFASQVQKHHPKTEVSIVSRHSDWHCDFSKVDEWDRFITDLRQAQPTHILYSAGGGPHGDFATKNWRDHEWAWRVNFLFPSYLLHGLMRAPLTGLKQFVLVGSQIAEQHADPQAASYAAAKHALRGLVTSVQAESTRPLFDLRLFSPGYMETALLPAQSWPRRQGLARPPEEEAERLLRELAE